MRWAAILGASGPSTLAYRPFVSTDAAVVEANKTEVELAADFARRGGERTIAAPDLRYNYGIARNWEVVGEGVLQVFNSERRRDVQLLMPQIDLKGVLVEGPLQGGAQPVSVAVEFSALLPKTVAHSGWGFESTVVASFRLGGFTWHANAGGGVAREGREPLVLWGIIAEYPLSPRLRIAAEVNGESEHRTRPDNSALLGFLYEHRDVTYDIGVRGGLSKAAPDLAATAGLTFEF